MKVRHRAVLDVVCRFTKDREPNRLTRVEPLVVEVSADVAWSGHSFHHPLRLLRARARAQPGR